eukprot:COSAG01_NODE_399_length_17543_cov_15.077792_1_plen_119_part_00
MATLPASAAARQPEPQPQQRAEQGAEQQGKGRWRRARSSTRQKKMCGFAEAAEAAEEQRNSRHAATPRSGDRKNIVGAGSLPRPAGPGGLLLASTSICAWLLLWVAGIDYQGGVMRRS